MCISKFASASAFEKESSGTSVCDLTGSLLNDIVIFQETVLSVLLKDVALPLRLGLFFRHDRAEECCGKMFGSG
jgi:hypothetical protein